MTLHHDFQFRPATAMRAAHPAEGSASRYLQYRHVLAGGFSRHSDAVLAKLNVGRRLHILDAGCGFGDMSIRLANATGPKGEVLGIDVSQGFLDHAWHAAEIMWVPNVRFACCRLADGLDAAPFDMVFSRFGMMESADPVVALAAMRACLKPGGRFAQVIWRDRAENPWINEACTIVARHLPAQTAGMSKRDPAPRSASAQDMLRMQMTEAGFAGIAFQRIDAKLLVGRDIADAVAFQLDAGPAGDMLRAAGEAGQRKRAEIEAELARMFEQVIAREGGLWMDSASWLITAVNPA